MIQKGIMVNIYERSTIIPQRHAVATTANELIVGIGCCYGHGNAYGVQAVEPLVLKWKRIYPSVAPLVESFTSVKKNKNGSMENVLSISNKEFRDLSN